jgi:GTPase KRas protein
VPIVIVGNKKDYYNGREVSTEEGKMLADSLGCDFFETSAKTNSNVENCFKSVVRHIKTDKRGYAPMGNGSAGGQGGGSRQKKKKCVVL